MTHLLGDYLDGYLHRDQKRRARVAQLVDRPVAEARFNADPWHGLTELVGIQGRPDIRGEDQFVVVAQRFLAAALGLATLARGRLNELNIEIPQALLDIDGLTPGLFERHGLEQRTDAKMAL